MTKIYFNEELHRYTDDFGNVYTSVTTKLGEFEEPFDTDAEARKCAEKGRQGLGRYVGMTEQQIKAQWKSVTKVACDRGTEQHNELEYSIKISNGYTRTNGEYINDRLYTLPEVLENPNHGELDINTFLALPLATKFPDFTKAIIYYHSLGYRMFPELGVFSYDHLISGLIDLPLINFETKKLIIIDYKTNKKELEFRSGYYKKTYDGKLTDQWIDKVTYFKAPINNIEKSKGNTYTLQLSFYGNLCERFGLELIGLYLFHIKPQTDEYGDYIPNSPVTTKWYDIKYLKTDINKILNVHYNKLIKTRNTQTTLFK